VRWAVWVVGAGALAAAPFSHKLHLKLKPDCLSCHAAAAQSTRPADNLMPGEAVCAPCHKSVAIRKPEASLLTAFDHRKHLAMGNPAPVIAAAIDSKAYLSPPGDIRRHLDTKNACAACHRGMEESEEVTHAALPQMADCLTCHSRIDNPFSCETCHARGPHLRPATHTPDYLDRHNSKKIPLDKPSCAVCHGRRFTCLGCH
jgi:predicted CXXCH cytochrome family protein